MPRCQRAVLPGRRAETRDGASPVSIIHYATGDDRHRAEGIAPGYQRRSRFDRVRRSMLAGLWRAFPQLWSLRGMTTKMSEHRWYARSADSHNFVRLLMTAVGVSISISCRRWSHSRFTRRSRTDGGSVCQAESVPLPPPGSWLK